MIRRTLPVLVRSLGDHEVEVIVSTDVVVEQDGLMLMPHGVQLDGYRKNPIWLWSHDVDKPVARAEEIAVNASSIAMRVRFAAAGVSGKADEVRGLVKDGIVSAASIGFDFDPKDAEPIDAKNPRAGRRVNKWTLYECSFVAVPADSNALVTARDLMRGTRMAEWKIGASRNLPIEDSDEWDGPAAEKSIFEFAGGDDFDPAKARRGFLVYDSEKPKERGSYKLPIAHAVDGELKVPKGAIRAVASRLPDTDIPDDVKKDAESVLDAYKKKAGIGEDDGEHSRTPRRARRKSQRQAPPNAKLRGMYGVAMLAYLVGQLGWATEDAEIEASIEGDESQVPAMLKKCLADLGDALIAMTIEEVKELVDDDDGTDVTEGLADEEVVIVGRCRTPAARRFRAGFFRARAAVHANRAGKALSAANAERLQEAEEQHKRALKHHEAAVECHAAVGLHHRALDEAHGKAHAAQGDLTAELGKGEACDLERCMRAAKTIGRNLDAMGEENTGLGDEHEEMADCHRGVARSVRAARRSVRAVDGFEPAAGGTDGDSTLVQKSGGTAEDEGSRDADFRRRQAERLRLAAA